MAEKRTTYKIQDLGGIGEVHIADEVVAIVAGLAATIATTSSAMWTSPIPPRSCILYVVLFSAMGNPPTDIIFLFVILYYYTKKCYEIKGLIY